MVRNTFLNINNHSSIKVTLSGAIALLATISYLIQFSSSVFGSYAIYRIFLTISLFMLLSTKKSIRLKAQLSISSFWIVMLFSLACFIITSGLSVSSIMDWYTYFVGVAFVCSLGEDENVLRSTFKVIILFGIFFAISVWIQFALPQVYNFYLRLISSDTAAHIQRLWSVNGLITGFSTNPGFTAGHIVSALILVFAYSQATKTQRGRAITKPKFIALLLLSALFLTGKRGHLLALIFSVLSCYLVNTRGKKRLMALNVLMVSTVIIIPILFLFSDILLTIPVLGRLGDTIAGLINGNDVSNGRNSLYALALFQFRSHPILGIGWGKFRTSVVGTVTIMTQLDTHNIYLQLLCETGIVGFVSVILPMLVFVIQSIKNIGIISSAYANDIILRCAGIYSLGYQLFFIVYGLSGNPLYDYNYAIMYFISCGITALIYRKVWKGNTT